MIGQTSIIAVEVMRVPRMNSSNFQRRWRRYSLKPRSQQNEPQFLLHIGSGAVRCLALRRIPRRSVNAAYRGLRLLLHRLQK